MKLTTTNGNGKHKYASERDELVALIEASTGRRPDTKLVRTIAETLEVRGATLREYIDDTAPRIPLLGRQPSGGFFIHQAKSWGAEDASPVAAPEIAEERNAHGRCAKCNGIGKCGDAYCDCKLGKDLKAYESRPAKIPPAAVVGGAEKARLRK